MKYRLEDIRKFFMHRPYLASKHGVITPDEYDGLKLRSLNLPRRKTEYLRAFIEGWQVCNLGLSSLIVKWHKKQGEQ